MGAEVEYIRRVYYYETDRMGIVHHSNYIRWMEEARVEFMRENGADYEGVEKKGVLIPVTGVSCTYRRSAFFGDTVRVCVRLTSCTGARAAFSYRMYDAESGELLAEGESGHCFIDAETHRPVNAKRRLPEEYATLAALVSEGQEGESDRK